MMPKSDETACSCCGGKMKYKKTDEKEKIVFECINCEWQHIQVFTKRPAAIPPPR